ncbi:contractile injection system tape measure protein [Algoriphagus sp. D3-2-R+10]|uniref:contractile injection system tape measure protein n=1 Tax=Algoriphagus aurantiacus TaxID=3103948 RepID=UPI002B373564|nr:contractile injection system tape measure protein [Algoriphagus sp. D3-2-R+10]MEB2773759.1 contractile injection system tape measure protein [Algoriphagus sp. D3-2-R+10]
MSLTQNHKVHTASFQVNFEGIEEGLGLQDNLALIFYEKVIPALEKEFDEFADPSSTLVINELELDCGLLTSENWEEELLQKVIQQVRKELVSSQTEKPTVLTRKEKATEVFFYFLEKGFFPWNSPFSTPIELEREVILDNAFWGKLSASFQKTVINRDRFNRSFTQKFIIRIFEKLAEKSNPLLLEVVNHFLKQSKEKNLKELLDRVLSSSLYQKEISARELLKTLIFSSNEENYLLIANFLGYKLKKDIGFREEFLAMLSDIQKPELLPRTRQLLQTIQNDHPDIMEELGVSSTEFRSVSPISDSRKSTDKGIILKSKEMEYPLNSDSSNSSEPKMDKSNPEKPVIDEDIYVENAGLILLHPFLGGLFSNLQLTENGKFVANREIYLAAKVLQFLVYGENELTENYFVLNKILCGLGVSQVLNLDSRLNSEIKDECIELLQEVIGHWAILKNTSVDGLRETFLKRSGKLSQVEKGWKLTVERKTVDVLLDKLPWGLGIIKLPWMNEMLYVDWN